MLNVIPLLIFIALSPAGGGLKFNLLPPVCVNYNAILVGVRVFICFQH